MLYRDVGNPHPLRRSVRRETVKPMEKESLFRKIDEQPRMCPVTKKVALRRMQWWIVSNAFTWLSFDIVFKASMSPTPGILKLASFEGSLKMNSGPDSLLVVSRVFKIIINGKGGGKGNTKRKSQKLPKPPHCPWSLIYSSFLPSGFSGGSLGTGRQLIHSVVTLGQRSKRS